MRALFLSIIILSANSILPQTFTSSDLPIIVINTNGVPIPDEPKINAEIGVIFNGEGVRNYLTDPFTFESRIGIEIRGSSSQSFPKKQYAVETRDSLGEDLKVSLLGFPEESDWILSAPYNDKTLMRNTLAYALANEIGRYASRTKYCELVINGEYRGLYILMEKIKRDKNRVDIKKMTDADTTGIDVTGGYIIKIDKLDGAGNAGWYSIFPPVPFTNKKILYQYDYPKPEDINWHQKTYIQNFIYEFEKTMYSPSYADTAGGFLKYIDINSFVDYFLINELTKNVDGYRLSAFMHKDRDDESPLLKMGPIWDFNHSFGNADYYDEWKTDHWQLDYFTGSQDFLNHDSFLVPFWWKVLKNDSLFSSLVVERWNELKTSVFGKSHIYSQIDSISVHIEEARNRNFIKWPVIGTYVWPNAYVGSSYTDEINYLKNWISARISWLEANIPKLVPVNIDEENASVFPDKFYLSQNYPNPFNPSTKIRFQIPESGFVSLKVFDMLGNEIETLVEEEKEKGFYDVIFNALKLSSGIYFYKLIANGHTSVKKMVLLK